MRIGKSRFYNARDLWSLRATRNGHPRFARLAKIAYTGVGNHVIRSGSRDLSALYYASARSRQFCIVARLFLRVSTSEELGKIREVFGKTRACDSPPSLQ
jgi:hypothetical protein